MAHANTVLRSINDEGESRCIDVFRRPDGSFGFEEFRRDAEDSRGWFPVGGYSAKVFRSENSALEAARGAVLWLPSCTSTDGRPVS